MSDTSVIFKVGELSGTVDQHGNDIKELKLLVSELVSVVRSNSNQLSLLIEKEKTRSDKEIEVIALRTKNRKWYQKESFKTMLAIVSAVIIVCVTNFLTGG